MMFHARRTNPLPVQGNVGIENLAAAAAALLEIARRSLGVANGDAACTYLAEQDICDFAALQDLDVDSWE